VDPSHLILLGRDWAQQPCPDASSIGDPVMAPTATVLLLPIVSRAAEPSAVPSVACAVVDLHLSDAGAVSPPLVFDVAVSSVLDVDVGSGVSPTVAGSLLDLGRPLSVAVPPSSSSSSGAVLCGLRPRRDTVGTGDLPPATRRRLESGGYVKYALG